MYGFVFGTLFVVCLTKKDCRFILLDANLCYMFDMYYNCNQFFIKIMYLILRSILIDLEHLLLLDY
jgi:hypothetical protein